MVYKKVETSTTGVVGGKTIATENVTTDETGKIIDGTKNIVYVYKPVGSVVIHYVNTKGEVIKQEVKDITEGDIDTAYNAADNVEAADEKPQTITNGGVTYNFQKVSTSNEVGGKVVVSTNAANVVGGETGTIVPGTTHVIYVYDEEAKPEAPKGTVIVKYEDEEGNEIKESVEDTPLSPVDTPYNTIEKRDEKIEVPNPNDPENPTVYYLSKKEPKDGSEPEEGKVKEGESVVTYVYKKAGSVIVHYVDEAGNTLADDQVAKKDAKEGTEYDTTTTTLRPSTIEKAGKTYELVPVGTYGVGEVDKDGHLTTTAAVNGEVESGKTKEITYVYREVVKIAEEPKGSVVVHYVDEAGNVIKTSYNDTTDQAPGTDYKTNESDLEKPQEITFNGKAYELVKVSDSNTVGGKEIVKTDDKNIVAGEQGKVVEGTTNVIYIYKEKTAQPTPDPVKPGGQVTAQYFVEGTETRLYEDPSVEKDTVIKEKDTPVDTPYGDTPPVVLTDKDGNLYDLMKNPDDTPKLKEGSAPTDGKVTEKPQVIQYEYKKRETPKAPKKGSVVVHYVNEAGEVIKSVYNDTTDAPVGTDYNTADDKLEKPDEITFGGKTYRYKEISYGNTVNNKVIVPNTDTDFIGEEKSKVISGTTHIIYVYKEVVPETPPKEDPVKPGGQVTAQYFVEGTETRLYEDPTVKEDTVVKEANTPVDTRYNDTPPVILTDEQGNIYDLVKDEAGVPKLRENSAPTNGKVIEAPQVIQYEYKKRETPPTEDPGKYIPYVPADPENPDPKNPDPNIELPEVPYDETPDNPYDDPRLPDVPGYVPVDPNDPDGNEPLKPVDPNDPSKGYIPPTPTDPKETPVVYVKAGNVIVKYVNENGEEIKDQVYDERKQPNGKDYDTKVDNRPNKLVGKDGKFYELVPAGTYKAGEVDTDGHLTTSDAIAGNVVGGKDKTVVYVYREVKTTPELPPTPPAETPNKYIPYIPEDPTDPSNPNDPKYPTDPENNPPLDPNGKPIPPVDYDNTPEDPSDNPPLPDIDGYVPVDPNDPTKPLKPKDPNDPTKGYEPPKPVDPKKDTPVPYVPAGTVTVHYVNEEGDVIQDPTVDTPKSPVGTDYNTNENGKEIPTKITTADGRVYELVKVKAGDKESGKVVKGNTDVTYIYKLVSIPGQPQPGGENPTPNPEPTPGKPEQPGHPAPVKSAKATTATLPKTGDTAGNAAVAYGAAALGFAALLGLGKKKSEDEE